MKISTLDIRHYITDFTQPYQTNDRIYTQKKGKDTEKGIKGKAGWPAFFDKSEQISAARSLPFFQRFLIIDRLSDLFIDIDQTDQFENKLDQIDNCRIRISRSIGSRLVDVFIVKNTV